MNLFTCRTNLQGLPTLYLDSGEWCKTYHIIRIDLELLSVSCIILEDNASVLFVCWNEGFLYLVWYNGLWFGLAQYVPFEATL